MTPPRPKDFDLRTASTCEECKNETRKSSTSKGLGAHRLQVVFVLSFDIHMSSLAFPPSLSLCCCPVLLFVLFFVRFVSCYYVMIHLDPRFPPFQPPCWGCGTEALKLAPCKRKKLGRASAHEIVTCSSPLHRDDRLFLHAYGTEAFSGSKLKVTDLAYWLAREKKGCYLAHYTSPEAPKATLGVDIQLILSVSRLASFFFFDHCYLEFFWQVLANCYSTEDCSFLS